MLRAPDHDVRLARLREWLRTGLWFLPMLWAVAALAAAVVLVAIDHRTGGDDPTWLVPARGADSARSVLGVVAGSTITFTGTVFSITIVALQLASTQFSPRVLRAFLRDRPTQHCLGVFVATSLYSLMVLREVGDDDGEVPGLAVSGAFLLVLASVFAFVFLVHHIAQSVRAVSIVEAVARETRDSVDSNHPITVDDPLADVPTPDGPPAQLVTWQHTPGVVLGIDEDDLVALAAEAGVVIELVPLVGDFVPTGAAVFAVHGGVVDSDVACRFVGIGLERTLHQDTAFGLRQLVDIAEKALSPAINDPTTAVQCLDRIHDILRRLAGRPLHSGRYGDESGALRLVVPRVSFDDLLQLAFDEIRHFGIGSMQVPRRMRAALLDLREIALPERVASIDAQIDALDSAVVRTYEVHGERVRAAQPDGQGLR